MAKHTTTRLYHAAVRALQRRDRMEMRIVDALLSAVETRHDHARPRRTRRTASPPRWTGFRSVLCPIDFSEQSRTALQYAAAVARRGRGTLTVIYVNDPLLVAAAAAALHDRTLATRSQRELRDFVDRTLGGSPRERLRVRIAVATGAPPAEILKAARRDRCDLIVLGTHGLTGADRMLLGSTTAAVLTRAAVPILAIPRRAPALTPRQRRLWPKGPIIAALALGGEAAHDAGLAGRIAQWFGASLLLMHVVPETSAPAWMTATLGYRQRDRARLARAERWLAALAGLTRHRVRTDIAAACGTLADELAARAAASRAALVVTVLRTRRFGARRGGVSYEFLSHATTPVLACPPRWRR